MSPVALTRACGRSVRTMSEKALANRIKVIERAKGQHAVIKMRLFARVLFLEARPHGVSSSCVARC